MGIKKLSKNKYHARYFAGYNSQGKRVYPSKTFKTRKDANTWLTAKLREKHLGQYADTSTQTLAQYLDQWLQTKKHSLRENTLRNYKVSIENYIRHDLGRMKLAAIRPVHIEQWQAGLLERLAPRSVQYARGVLSSALERAVRHKLINHNPIRDAEKIKSKKSEMQCLTPEQAGVFLANCQSDTLGLLLKFMLNTGLRPEEAVAVRWSDLTMNGRGAVRVREAVLRTPGGGWKFVAPKTKNSQRKIGFPSALVVELKEHRKTQLEQRLKSGKRYHDHNLVFAGGRGEPFCRGTVVNRFKSILEQSGLPKTIRLYDLRHSFVTLSLIAGVDVKTVSEEAGHATVAFTLDAYGHVLQVMREAAVDKREALFLAMQEEKVCEA